MDPDFRATIRRDGLVRLVAWHPGLATWGPLTASLEARGRAGVTIADITIEHEQDLDSEDDSDEVVGEAFVTYITAPTRIADAALTEWAELVGYRDLWLPGGIHRLHSAAGGQVMTRCTGCRARHSDAHPEFWAMIRRCGYFPLYCPLCGADLPQWTAVRAPSRTHLPRPTPLVAIIDTDEELGLLLDDADGWPDADR